MIWFSELSCADSRRDDDMIDCAASRWQRLFMTARLSVSDPALDSKKTLLSSLLIDADTVSRCAAIRFEPGQRWTSLPLSSQ